MHKVSRLSVEEALFNNHLVRQLAWVIRSTPLMVDLASHPSTHIVSKEICDFYLKKHLKWLKELDKNPAAVFDFMARQNYTRLGKYFEMLIEFWLRSSPHFELLLQNEQVYDNKTTIGEFDFVFYNKLFEKTEHWEVAVKFYLSNGISDEWNNYIGPNANDNLALKMMRSIDKQLLLSSHPAAQKLLREKEIHIDSTSLFMKGYLVYPWGSTAKSIAKFAHAQHEQFDWLRINELGKPFFKNQFWVILPKLYWLGQNNLPFGELIVYDEKICFW
ncbi:MAG: DUF1853 family protein [Flavobacteriales bacterium]